MPEVIEKEEFIHIGKIYVFRLLHGICENEILLAVGSQPQTVRIVAKLSPEDFQAVKFSGLYISVQKIVKRFGQRHLDPATNAPHTAEFKLYDPYFESLDFQPVEDGAE